MDHQELTLSSLLEGLMTKAASAEDDKKGDKEEGKDGKGKGEMSEEDKAKAEKDKKNGEDKKEQEKSATVKSASELEQEIMKKFASSDKVSNEQQKDNEMITKSASAAGKLLAEQLLKQAGIGDVSTTNGIMPGVVPNKVIQDNAALVAQQNAIIQAQPGTDGAGNGGTVNQIFDAVVADAKAKGVVEQGGQTASAPAEGAGNAMAAPAQVMVDESREKMAALHALVESGYDFDKAVDLVKAASDELNGDQESQIKQAALNELIEAGVHYDFAVALVNTIEKQ